MSWSVVVFQMPGLDSGQALVTLYEKFDIGCAALGPNIRFSPHFYNTLDEIERAVDALARLTVLGRSTPKTHPLWLLWGLEIQSRQVKRQTCALPS